MASTEEGEQPEPQAEEEPEEARADLDSKIKIDEASSEKSSSQKLDIGETPQVEDGGSTARKTPEASGSRPLSSSSAQAKSSASGEIVFEAKKKKKRGGSDTRDAHTVTFTVSIAMAIPTVFEEKDNSAESQVEDEDQPDLKALLKKKKQVFEAPRPQNYYHVEYYLVPEEDELMKTDVVTYGMAAKLYMERHDARVIKTWQDGEITWVAWAHSHTMTVTKGLLLKLFDHTLELRVWDTKDRCSTRARFDRPKAFRLPQPKPGESPEDVGGVKAMVMKQLNGFNKMQAPKGNTARPLPQRCAFPKNNVIVKKSGTVVSGDAKPPSQEQATARGKNLVAVPANKTGDNARTFSRLGRLAGTERPVQSPGGKESKTSKASGGSNELHQTLATPKPPPPRSSLNSSKSLHSPSPLQLRSNLRSGESEDSTIRNAGPGQDNVAIRRRMKKTEAAAAAAEQAKKFGICMVPFRMALLFSGMKSVTSRLQQAVNGVEDMFITVSLDKPLLSDEHKRELNPMIITVKSVSDMPNRPMDFEELHTRCQPAYVKYKFFKQPEHVTIGKEHARNIYWDDKNVVLLGTQEPSELREYLTGPPMMVEVHDCDRKTEDVKLKATLFGDDLEDEKISNVGTVASRRTLHNPFKGRNKPWDPYGVSHVDLSELLLGHRFLELKVPIRNSPIPDVLGMDIRDTRLIGVAGAVDGPVDRPLSSGRYVHSGATLKIHIELASPLITPEQLAAKEELETTAQCPFGRIIFIFAYKNTTMLHQLQQLIMSINAHALELDDMPQHVIDAALSTYKLSIEQQRSVTLDIVTGFHVLDGEKHIFVLEGLLDSAIHKLWKELPRPEYSDVRVLYNSDFSFSQRLYGPLDVDLCRVKLHEPLRLVVQQSLLYVRDMVPRPCFQALIRLEEMTRMHLIKDIVKNDIFPTTEMVVSMSKEFGVPFTAEDFEELRPQWEKPLPPPVVEARMEVPGVLVQTSRVWTPIDNFNQTFINDLNERKEKGSTHDFISQNKDTVRGQSEVNQMIREKTKVPTTHSAVQVAHNYSTQTLNSTELANQTLREILQEKDPDARYTRCQEFLHSSTIVPVDTVALAKQEQQQSKALWRNEKGWVFPGKRTVLQSNKHPKKPHTARIDELREQWVENLLHVSLLQPPLDRDRFPWEYRHQDLELYKRPPGIFQNEPLSMFLPGVKQEEEKQVAKQKEAEKWRQRVVVADTAQHFHRLLPQTEMTDSGFYSSNQLDRLTCLLKDPPHKLSLQTHVCDIPPLSVVHYPSVDTLARARGLPLPTAIPGEDVEKTKGYQPGPYLLSSWSVEDNRVPVYDYQHTVHAAHHGKDFSGIHTERQKLWKRPIVPLTHTEHDSHLFHSPMASWEMYPALPALGKTMDVVPESYKPIMRTDAATSTQDLPQSLTAAACKRELVIV